ncbi:hypothetical protein ACFLV4_06860 [Chloroflexota bacterium]
MDKTPGIGLEMPPIMMCTQEGLSKQYIKEEEVKSQTSEGKRNYDRATRE